MIKSNTVKRDYFPDLDTMRFFAFFAVFLEHSLLHTFYKIDIDNQYVERLFTQTIFNGGYAVSFFFVLSGFLITNIILQDTEQNKFSLKNFYMRRTLRIWPLYFLVIIFGFYLYPFLKSLIGMDTNLINNPIMYFTFLANFDHLNFCLNNLQGQSAMMLNITWSIAIEEQFYLIWPLIILFFRKRMKVLPIVFIVIILFSTFFRYYYNSNHHFLDNTTPDSFFYFRYFHTFSVMSDLVIGGLIAYSIRNFKHIKPFIINLSKLQIITLYTLGSIGLYFYSVDDWFGRIVSASFFSFVILEQSFALNSIFKLRRIIFAKKLGLYTYGLYLLHPIAMQIVDNINRVLIKAENTIFYSVTSSILSFILVLLLAYTSFHIFEKPFLKLKNKF